MKKIKEMGQVELATYVFYKGMTFDNKKLRACKMLRVPIYPYCFQPLL